MNFIKVAAGCPITKVANTDFNLYNIQQCINNAEKEHCKLIVFPELCITSYTCADLFGQRKLLSSSNDALDKLCAFSKDKDIVIAVGAPIMFSDSLYNCGVIIFNGIILGIVPKSYIPNYTEFYEKRWFSEGIGLINKKIDLPFSKDIPFGTNLIFQCGDIKIGFEICEDLWVPISPGSQLSLMGANIIGNLSSSNEIVSKAAYRKDLVLIQSAKNICSYIYSSSGVHESTTDLVFSGHLIISENGTLLKENERFQRDNSIITSIVDIDKLNMERLKHVSFGHSAKIFNLEPCFIKFSYKDMDFGCFDRFIHKHPFVPSDKNEIEDRCREIFNIQTAGLAKRLDHTKLNKAVIGISGGLDSTLALLVTVKTFDILKIPRSNIICITMPGFGTTDRTYNNAVALCKDLRTDLREINIVGACLKHFNDIGHPVEKHDVTYENVQARERTQILMDIANESFGLLIGTGDLSELALGWCTYNGDHMSMYSVNCSVPKTLVRYLVNYVGETSEDKRISKILFDILDTPVSPELLPKDSKGNIIQKTEDIIGPYELHDFFLYYFIRQGAEPYKILFLAKEAFKGIYDEEIINHWLQIFLKRFFIQQFKRSAVPDGPKVGSISLSPRGDWRMPSDADFSIWMK